jgi:8-oxo-dGTP diphosphatase
MSGNAHPKVIEAAGGILWRRSAEVAELAVIHRGRHQDWSLPKGKRDPGESWQQTALREVFEETGCRAEIERFAGGTIYTVSGRPKVVLFWHMAVVDEGVFEPNDEVDRLEWMTPMAALERLDYETERLLLAGEVTTRAAGRER